MSILIPFLSLFISFLLGIILLERLSFKPRDFEWPAFALTIGIIMFTFTNYLSCLIFTFPKGIWISQIILIALESVYFISHKQSIKKIPYYLKSFFLEKNLAVLNLVFGLILIALFHTHILFNIHGDLYVGDSTYGDLPFHLSIISNIAYGQQFPPDNTFYAYTKLVYPYFINFYSAILVHEGMSLRNSIIIPGLLLSLSLISLIYGFALEILRNKFNSTLVVILYFMNGGIGFYFFLKDNLFNPYNILTSLFNPTIMKEYSHMWDQNIQWVNFLSRMLIPERSLLFGIPIGIIILRLLFFRENYEIKFFDLLLTALLLSIMPLLHTHTSLVLLIILPVLGINQLISQSWKKNLKNYLIVFILTALFGIIHIPPFLNHIGESQNFIRMHFGWMQKSNESFWEFWFNNTYLLIPLTIAYFLTDRKINRKIVILVLCGFILFLLINLILFSPYDWDNIKFLFWIGLFFDLAAASVLGHLFIRKNILIRFTAVVILVSLISTALLSIWREMNVIYLLFPKEAITTGEQIKSMTAKNSVFLTYKVHNSPINNFAGRSILMSYPGLLWVHGINYQQRDQDINNIFTGNKDAPNLLQKYKVNFVVLEDSQPDGITINKPFFDQFEVLFKNNQYTIYKVNE